MHQCCSRLLRHSDGAARPIRVTGIPGRQCIGVYEHGARLVLGAIKDGDQATGMIVVAMAEDQRIRTAQFDFQAIGVMAQNVTLSRVKQDSPGAQLDPERKTMFRKQTVTPGRVLDKDCESNLVHDPSSVCAVCGVFQ